MTRLSYLLSIGIVLSLLAPLNCLATPKEKTLNYAVYALPQFWDPAFGTTVADLMMKVNVFEGLTSIDAKGNVTAGAARGWDISADGLSYTFYLRPDLRWSDGSPLIAQHFANTIIRIHQGNGKDKASFNYSPIKNSDAVLARELPVEHLGVKAIDELTLRFELVKPTHYFLESLTTASSPSPPVLHKRLSSGTPWPITEFVGNGAYKLVAERGPEQGYHLIKNPYYRLKDDVYFEAVNIRRYKTANQAFFALASGEIDVYDRYRGNQLSAIQAQSDSSPLVHTVQTGIPSVDYLTLNGQDETLKDRRVRQAMSMALDRRAIASKLGYQDPNQAVAYSLTPPMPSMNWQPLVVEWQDLPLTQRQEQARQLLAEAGYGQGRRLKLELLVNQGNDNEQMAEQVRQQWQVIGIDAKVIANPTRVHYQTYLRPHRYQVARAGWAADYQDPMSFLETQQPNHKSNFGRWFNQEYTQTIRSLKQQVLTPEEQLAGFVRLEQLLQQELPIIPLYYKTSFALLARHLAPVNQEQGSYLLWRHFKPQGKL